MVDTGGSLPSRCSRYSLRSRVNLVTLDQLLPLTMLQQNKNPSLSLLIPSHSACPGQRPALGFHLTGQEPSSNLFCDVSFLHENMNCNTIPRTILMPGPCPGPDKIKHYQFEPSGFSISILEGRKIISNTLFSVTQNHSDSK